MGTTDNFDAPASGALESTDQFPIKDNTTSRAAYATMAQAATFFKADVATPGVAEASKALVLGSGRNIDFLQFGSTAIASLLTGAGTSVTPYAMGTTADKNLLGFWAETTATTGDTRGMYLRLYFEGAGGSGEAARIFGTVNNVTAATGGTVNGAHVTLSVAGASGAVSGAGNALRATLALGASTNAGGTLAALQLDSDFDNTATVPDNAAAIRVTDSNTKKWSKFLRLPTVASGGLLAAHTTDAMTHSVRIVDEAGTVIYLMGTTTSSNRTGGA